MMFGIFFSVALSLLSVALFSDSQILNLLIILGQAHFLISYFYMHKVGKLDVAFQKKIVSLAVVISGLCIYVYNHQEYLNLLAFLTGVLFVFHYYNDEIKVQGVQHYYFILGSLASMVAFSGVYANKLFGITYPLVYIAGVISLLLFFYFLYVLMKNRENMKSKTLFYLLFFTFLNCTIPTLLISVPSVSGYQIFGFIILFHYFRWYIYYADFLKDDTQSLYFYIKTIFSIHFLVIALYVQYTLLKYDSYLIYIFAPIFFYGWTVMHILLSIRKGDITRYA